MVAWPKIVADRTALRRAAHAGFDLIFPPSCPLCGQEQDHTGLCGICERAIVLPQEQLCSRCGHEVPRERYGDLSNCAHCLRHPWEFDRVVTLGPYRGLLQRGIVRLKHPGEQCLSLAIAELLWRRAIVRTEISKPDWIVPVPMHWWRRLTRGNSSAGLLATHLASLWPGPVYCDGLRCCRNTRKQSMLSLSERGVNVRNAYAVAAKQLRGGHVALVDDTMTTGSTADEIARCLKQAGAAEVTVLVAARAMASQ